MYEYTLDDYQRILDRATENDDGQLRKQPGNVHLPIVSPTKPADDQIDSLSYQHQYREPMRVYRPGRAENISYPGTLVVVLQ